MQTLHQIMQELEHILRAAPAAPGGGDSQGEAEAPEEDEPAEWNLREEATSVWHLMCHLPKNKYCPYCRKGKLIS